MRYRCQLFNAEGESEADFVIEQDKGFWREDDVHILSRVAIYTVQYNFTNGTKVILGPLEFDCPLCGEYDHKEQDCPETCDLDSDDPFDERDYDDLPAVDES